MFLIQNRRKEIYTTRYCFYKYLLRLKFCSKNLLPSKAPNITILLYLSLDTWKLTFLNYPKKDQSRDSSNCNVIHLLPDWGSELNVSLKYENSSRCDTHGFCQKQQIVPNWNLKWRSEFLITKATTVKPLKKCNRSKRRTMKVIHRCTYRTLKK